MNLRSEIREYQDVNGYVNPYKVDTTKGMQCDNSVMFTSEYYIMLAKRCEDRILDDEEWENLVRKTYPIQDAQRVLGLPSRYMYDNRQCPPDDLYAIFAAAKILDCPGIAQEILEHGIRHWGFYNNSNPNSIKTDGKISWKSFLWRQPQLLYANLCAANKTHRLNIFQWPLAIYSAGTIAISCMNLKPGESDAPRLNWLLIEATRYDSWLCNLASKIWWKRMRKFYGVETNREAIRKNASIYYGEEHPFTKYWIE